MKWLSSWIGKVQAFFTERDRIDALLTLLNTFGLNDKHIRFVFREILEMRDAALTGSEKRDKVADTIKAAHDDALTFDGGLKWPAAALEMLSHIVQLVYILAKLSRKI